MRARLFLASWFLPAAALAAVEVTPQAGYRSGALEIDTGIVCVQAPCPTFAESEGGVLFGALVGVPLSEAFQFELLVNRQDRRCGLGVEPHAAGEGAQDGVVRDVQALGEIGREEALLEVRLAPGSRGPRKQAVRGEGDHRADAIEAQLEPVLPADPDHAVDHRLGLVEGRAVLGGEPPGVVDALR